MLRPQPERRKKAPSFVLPSARGGRLRSNPFGPPRAESACQRAIIGRLADGPARFLDVAEPFDTALDAVGKHLKLLERAGLIERRKQGREVIISFGGEPLREVAGWVSRYERFLNERLDRLERHFEETKGRKAEEP
jgi:DNA-binding transcriptional ArsR family regulator